MSAENASVMKWESEKQLFDSFRDWCAGRFDFHPEQHPWDAILVDGDGRRMGVQGKLEDGATVVAQCVESLKLGAVDCAAILMPQAGEAIRRLCTAYGLGVIVPIGEPSEPGGTQPFTIAPPKGRNKRLNARDRPRKKLPMTPSSLPAGVPSPRSIKDGEFMLEVLLHARGGYLTNKDFQRVGWPERFPPKWLWKQKGRPRFEPTLTAILPSELDKNAYEAMKRHMEARGLANV